MISKSTCKILHPEPEVSVFSKSNLPATSSVPETVAGPVQEIEPELENPEVSVTHLRSQYGKLYGFLMEINRQAAETSASNKVYYQKIIYSTQKRLEELTKKKVEIKVKASAAQLAAGQSLSEMQVHELPLEKEAMSKMCPSLSTPITSGQGQIQTKVTLEAQLEKDKSLSPIREHCVYQQSLFSAGSSQLDLDPGASHKPEEYKKTSKNVSFNVSKVRNINSSFRSPKPRGVRSKYKTPVPVPREVLALQSFSIFEDYEGDDFFEWGNQGYQSILEDTSTIGPFTRSKKNKDGGNQVKSRDLNCTFCSPPGPPNNPKGANIRKKIVGKAKTKTKAKTKAKIKLMVEEEIRSVQNDIGVLSSSSSRASSVSVSESLPLRNLHVSHKLDFKQLLSVVTRPPRQAPHFLAPPAPANKKRDLRSIHFQRDSRSEGLLRESGPGTKSESEPEKQEIEAATEVVADTVTVTKPELIPLDACCGKPRQLDLLQESAPPSKPITPVLTRTKKRKNNNVRIIDPLAGGNLGSTRDAKTDFGVDAPFEKDAGLIAKLNFDVFNVEATLEEPKNLIELGKDLLTTSTHGHKAQPEPQKKQLLAIAENKEFQDDFLSAATDCDPTSTNVSVSSEDKEIDTEGSETLEDEMYFLNSTNDDTIIESIILNDSSCHDTLGSEPLIVLETKPEPETESKLDATININCSNEKTDEIKDISNPEFLACDNLESNSMNTTKTTGKLKQKTKGGKKAKDPLSSYDLTPYSASNFDEDGNVTLTHRKNKPIPKWAKKGKDLSVSLLFQQPDLFDTMSDPLVSVFPPVNKDFVIPMQTSKNHESNQQVG